MADEATAIRAWLYSRLTGDTDLSEILGDRVFPNLAPAGTAFPFAVYSRQASSETASLGMVRAVVYPLILIKIYDRESGFSRITDAQDRVDALLHGQSVTIGEMGLKCVRRQALESAEIVNNVQSRWLGQVYAFMAQPDTN